MKNKFMFVDWLTRLPSHLISVWAFPVDLATAPPNQISNKRENEPSRQKPSFPSSLNTVHLTILSFHGLLPCYAFMHLGSKFRVPSCAHVQFRVYF